MSEKVNHPSHYGGDVPFEAIKLIEDWGFGYGFTMGSAIKYGVRAGSKDGEPEDRDLGKAIWYLEHAAAITSRARDQGLDIRPPSMLRLSPSEAAKFHNLNEDRTEALAAMARRDPEAAVRFLTAGRR